MTAVIQLEKVHVLYGSTLALDVERIAVRPAERVFVLGASGSGKTTLARLIKGRLRPSTGTVRVLGSDPANRQHDRSAVQRRVAMIDQEFFLVPRSSVVRNLLHGGLARVSQWSSLLGWFPAAEWEKAEAILREVGLDGLGARRVETLSGGQRQRAAIARALMQDAEIILADEPVSNLDPELAEDALELLVDCVARRGVTLVVNIHQPELARRFATRLIGLAAGKVMYDGAPEAFTPEKAALLYRREERAAAPARKVLSIGDAGRPA
ncbi:MAG: phosphonate ABC transporter ATP-binding protein [Candidatus Acidiferrales bacterium]